MNPGDAKSLKRNDITGEIVDAALKVHRALGPGLLESVYEQCLCYELRTRGMKCDRQVAVPVMYGDVRIETGLCLDLLVEDLVIVELKAVEQMHPLYEAQLLTYLKLAKKELGLLLNFNVPLFKHGVKRIILDLPASS